MGFTLGNVEFVKGCLQVINLLFLRGLFTVGNLTHTLQDLCLRGIDLLWLLFLGFYLRSCLICRCLHGLSIDFFFLDYFVLTLFEGFFLRVHHLTI